MNYVIPTNSPYKTESDVAISLRTFKEQNPKTKLLIGRINNKIEHFVETSDLKLLQEYTLLFMPAYLIKQCTFAFFKIQGDDSTILGVTYIHPKNNYVKTGNNVYIKVG
jgi:hypothetical protein